MTPEETAAGSLLARHSLSPPVDVRELAARYADVEVDDMPVRSDAISIHHPGGNRRPLIILNRGSSARRNRVRFTLAHELGHILLPWHCGTVACHIDEEGCYVSVDHEAFEGEANRFASELLMPRAWVRRVIDEETLIERIFHRVADTAGVSHTAARIKLVSCLPPGSPV